MSDVSSEQPGLTPHTEAIASQIENKISSPETAFERGQEKEALYAVVGERLGKEPFSAPTPPPAKTITKKDLPSYEQPTLKPKVDELLSIALSKDLDDAINQVQKANDPALLDAFHDALTEKLYSHLVEAGKLKKIK
ncbi:MAG: hypothetical protein PHV43_03395 [Candidatus Colwellbacteria bacterium]|nr:hypothetical protein [Candidatus Colwellbacteria bacterium]